MNRRTFSRKSSHARKKVTKLGCFSFSLEERFVDVPQHEQMTRAAEGEEELEEEEMYPNLPRPRGPEDNYKRVYDNLTHQIAYRWPNPGEPR